MHIRKSHIGLNAITVLFIWHESAMKTQKNNRHTAKTSDVKYVKLQANQFLSHNIECRH